MTYIVHLIRSACVLHNIAIDDEFTINYNEGNAGNDTRNEFDNNEADDVDDRGAYANRDIIVNNLTM